jgi:hypothetical protein
MYIYMSWVCVCADSPGEWYYDVEGSMLYFYPNTSNSGPIQDMDVAIPLLEQAITILGDPSNASYVLNISFIGLEFTQTRVAYLEEFEVPSGGDWYATIYTI